MNRKQEILQIVQRRGRVTGPELCRELGISRQALNVHLKSLIADGSVVKEGRTRGTAYRMPAEGEHAPAPHKAAHVYRVKNLHEDRVLASLVMELALERACSDSALQILRYAFTEMLNNAIDHSQAETCNVSMTVGTYDVEFTVRDRGIGAFKSIADRFELADEHEAVQELLKGKTTTMADRHSGEGIFFTSKAADFMYLRSHRTKLVFDNARCDVFLETQRPIKGTHVVFRISRHSKRRLGELFERYAPEDYDYQFERTRVTVRLYQTEYISRSEAKRLVNNLDRFRAVVLDFKGVRSIGQGFADQVFRVFLGEHPAVSLRVEHLAPSLRPMVNHVVDNEARQRLTIT